jgi:hypothetical protein
MAEAQIHFVEIELIEKARKSVYRFYGQGTWKVWTENEWTPINAIYVPVEALQIAASQCRPAPQPVMTEIEIARLCGGR